MHWVERALLFSPCPFWNMFKLKLVADRQAHWTKVYAGGLFSVWWNDVLLHTISAKWRSGKNDVSGKRRSPERRSGKMTFGWTTIRKNVVRHYEVSLTRWFGYVTIRSNNFWQFFFGKPTIRQSCISLKRRFDEMMFRENDVAPP